MFAILSHDKWSSISGCENKIPISDGDAFLGISCRNGESRRSRFKGLPDMLFVQKRNLPIDLDPMLFENLYCFRFVK